MTPPPATSGPQGHWPAGGGVSPKPMSKNLKGAVKENLLLQEEAEICAESAE
jgi:hypothetical protein